MPDARQVGNALLYALVSIVLVVGGLSLALAEQGNASSINLSPTEIVSQSSTPVGPSSTSTSEYFPTTVPYYLFTTTPEDSSIASPEYLYSPTAEIPPSPIWPFPTYDVEPTITPLYFACGPFPRWIRSYSVQPGDTLFNIAALYRTTVDRLQRANCLTNFTIYPGQNLWVPYILIISPGVTIIPTFSTPTDVPTVTLTSTAIPFTTTTSPTDTSTPTP